MRGTKKCITFALRYGFRIETVDVAQSVRAPDCGSGCRGCESHLPPCKGSLRRAFFVDTPPRPIRPAFSHAASTRSSFGASHPDAGIYPPEPLAPHPDRFCRKILSKTGEVQNSEILHLSRSVARTNKKTSRLRSEVACRTARPDRDSGTDTAVRSSTTRRPNSFRPRRPYAPITVRTTAGSSPCASHRSTATAVRRPASAARHPASSCPKV